MCILHTAYMHLTKDKLQGPILMESEMQDRKRARKKEGVGSTKTKAKIRTEARAHT